MESVTTFRRTGLSALLADYATANVWAHRRYAAWLQDQPAALLEQAVPSSFPGIRATLIHIWHTEQFWLSVLEQTALPASFRWGVFEGTAAEIFAGLVQQSEALERYVHAQDEQALAEERLLDRPWAKGSRPQYDFIQHCLTHSAYHRGQIVSMSHQLGIKGALISDYGAFLMFPG